MKLEITVQRLQCFVEAAEQQSFRRAADALNVTQPALSQHIQVLERILRVSLFERSAKGVRLTPMGQQLVARARVVLNSVERLEEFADNLAAGQDGTISIACYPVHIERFLGSVIGAFRRDYPRVRLDLTRLRDDRRRGLGRSLLEELRDGEVDLAMAPRDPKLSLEGIKVYDAKILALVPDSDPYRHRPTIPVDSLKGRPVLIAPPKYFSRRSVENLARESGFDLQVEADSSTPSALLVLGRQGLGIPILPDDYPLVGQQRYPYPVITSPDGTEVSTPVWLQWRPESSLGPLAEHFLQYVRHEVEYERRHGRRRECYYQADLSPGT
jgi:DNA-binding transcriptional LysR family regulator